MLQGYGIILPAFTSFGTEFCALSSPGLVSGKLRIFKVGMVLLLYMFYLIPCERLFGVKVLGETWDIL